MRLKRLASVAAAGVITAACAHAMAQSPTVARKSLKDGVYTLEQAARGKVVYEQNCAECHMPDLAGKEYAGPLAGEGFMIKWRDAPLADFFGRVRTMPYGKPGLLRSDEYLEIVSYAMQKNGFPPGKSMLTVQLVRQWPQIRIERLTPAGQ